MSHPLISRSPDLARLRDKGFEIEISSANYLLIHNVPYVNAKCEIARATLASVLDLAGDRTARPEKHIALWTGDEPRYQDGSIITAIQHGAPNQSLGNELVARYSFSNKPSGGYPDYYAKMTRYIDIISHPAISLDRSIKVETFKVIPCADAESVFVYLDTASSRVGINEMSDKLRRYRIGIIGLGGTGGYVLDFVAKTPVAEIHTFDHDDQLQHNAFRSPGAMSLEELQKLPHPKKVDYFYEEYSKMHRKIIPHVVQIDELTIDQLKCLDFVFVCVDKDSVRRSILRKLVEWGIACVDVGMGVHMVQSDRSLVGSVRTTLSTAQKHDHSMRRIEVDAPDIPDDYDSNIQIAELNALNAALAVIKWKKLAGFYQDVKHDHQSVYSTNVNQLLNEECLDES